MTRVPRRMLLAILVLAPLLAPAGCRGTTRHDQQRRASAARWNTVRADAKARLAERYYKAGDVESASVELAAARQLDPDDPRLILLDARVRLAQDRTDEARRLLESLRLDGPLGAEAHYLLGVIAQQRLESNVALRHFEAAVVLDADQFDYLAALVQTLLQAGRIDEALRRLEQTRRRFAWRPGYQAALAEVYEQRGEFDKAAEAWKRVAAASEDDPEIRERLAIALLRAGNPYEAIPLLEDLLKDPGSLPPTAIRLMLAECLLQAGRYEEAKRHAAWILHESGEHADALDVLARAAVRERDFPRAWRLAERALRADPNNSQRAELAAALAIRAGRPQRARELLAPLADDPQTAGSPLVRQLLRACGLRSETGRPDASGRIRQDGRPG